MLNSSEVAGSLGEAPSRARAGFAAAAARAYHLRESPFGKTRNEAARMKQPNSSRARAANYRRERKENQDAASGAPAPDVSAKGVSGNGDATSAPLKKQKRRKYLREYVRWLWPYRWALLVVFILA